MVVLADFEIRLLQCGHVLVNSHSSVLGICNSSLMLPHLKVTSFAGLLDVMLHSLSLHLLDCAEGPCSRVQG